MGSCKTYQPIDLIRPKVKKEERTLSFEMRQLDRLDEVDSLKIEGLDKDDLFLIFQSISNDSIKGTIWKKGGKKLQEPIDSGVPIKEMRAIYVRKYDSTTTLMLIFVGFPVAAIGTFLLSQEE